MKGLKTMKDEICDYINGLGVEDIDFATVKGCYKINYLKMFINIY